MFDFQMSSIRSVSVVGAGEGEEVWEGLWGRRVGAGSWSIIVLSLGKVDVVRGPLVAFSQFQFFTKGKEKRIYKGGRTGIFGRYHF